MIKDRKYLDWLRSQPCILTGQLGSEYESVVPAHIGTHGRGLKTDNEALPMLNRLHQQGHQSGEISMIRQHAPDWLLRDALRAYARMRHEEWLNYGEWTGTFRS